MGFIERLFRRQSAPAAKGLTISASGLPVTWQNPDSVPAHLNGVVMAATKFVGRAFPEAPLIVERLEGDDWQQVREHRLAQMVARPNPYYGGNLLWSGVLTSLMTSGNAYVVKMRNGAGRPAELWFAPSSSVKPVCELGESYISYYEYRAQGRTFKLAPEDVLHFRDGIDPENPMLGLSPLAAVARELRADQELAQYTQSVLRNMGVVSVLITPKDGLSVFEEGHSELIKERFKAVTTGNLRGEPLVIDAPVDIQSPGWSPRDLDVASMGGPLEARICAVLGIHPTVLGLKVGLEHSTFSNMREAREAAWEQCIIPLQALCADVLNSQLLPELGDERRERCAFDLSRVRALAEDENARADRLAKVYQAGGIRRSEFRAALGYEATPEDDVFFTDIQFAGGRALSQAEVVKSLRERAAQRQAVYRSIEDEDVRDA